MGFCGKSTAVLLFLMQAIAIAPSYAITPQKFDLGDFKFTPQVAGQVSYQDNFLDNDDNKQDSWISTIAPKFELSQTRNLNHYQLSYELSNYNYWQSSDDNYTAHNFSALTSLNVASKHRLNLQADYVRDYEQRGKGYSIGFAGILKQPTGFEQYSAKAKYSFGAKTAQANIDIDYQFSKVNWDSVFINDLNIPQFDYSLDFTANREYQQNQIGSTFNYKTGAFTKITFSASHSTVSYDKPRPNQASLDSEDNSVFLGIEWQGSSITTGYARVGYSDRTFDDDRWGDTSGIRWQVGILWTPLTYSNFDFSTSRSLSETKGQGSSIENTNYNMSWQHQWLDRIATKLSIQFSDDSYGDTRREDENTIASATMSYQMHRNIDLSLSLLNAKRKSNIDAVEYEGNTIAVGIRASF
ncbi:outer membrane beta-barrel protein [Thalassotalea psychrophila]|uniref:Outer membrane beta-barrel protein n=1 Tax=Thalassotalea psychrophila TaxID=3065647 RepID=A0ABY9TTY3_9GAMM|nr:outer membrane beta-barrel protein [Colwelliaceae bacterium SQ149]